MLGVDDFVEGRVGVGVGAATDEGFALEERDAGSGAGESDGGGEASDSGTEDEDVGGGLVGHLAAHPKRRAVKDWKMPMARMVSLRGGGHGDALGEDGGGVGGDAVEEAVIDADEDTHGGTGVGVEQGDELVGATVERLRVELEGVEESKFVGVRCGSGGQGEDALGGDGVLGEEVGGKIDAAAVGVFFDVAKDVGELEGDAGVDGELVGAAVGVAEDANADEADDGGYKIAVVIERGEAVVDLDGARRAGGTGDFEGVDAFGLGLEVEGGAGDELLEEIVGDAEAAVGCR